MTIELFSRDGHRENHSNLAEFGPAPEGALALKFADDIEDGRWVLDGDDLAQLQRENAPLSYTAAGLEIYEEGR